MTQNIETQNIETRTIETGTIETGTIETGTADPRPLYRDALAWVRDLAAHVPAERLTDPTPCPEWDVRGLLGHLVATVDRARLVGQGGAPNAMPRVVTAVAADGWPSARPAAEDEAAA